MEKEFIPYEQALALKELGFDEPCLARYLILTFWERVTGEIKLQMTDCTINEEYLIKAPLYQQAFRWFREKYELYCPIDIYSHSHTEINFEFDITNKNMTISEYSNTNKSYEEAELKALKKLIEIVKNK